MRELAICEAAIARLELVADSAAATLALALAAVLALLSFSLASGIISLHALLLSPAAILATLGCLSEALVPPKLLLSDRVNPVLRAVCAFVGVIFPLLLCCCLLLCWLLLLGYRLLGDYGLLCFIFRRLDDFSSSFSLGPPLQRAPPPPQLAPLPPSQSSSVFSSGPPPLLPLPRQQASSPS
ncbi:unnamed protein product [Polarella glacialis]|uniref:Uncharacterized protein n=1 Tax=Polarella glacialis TaxID=89957 RepID=A0A813LDD3_POLGL|nr:unnamed protein product [Polarella glacialis]CAE8724834.1 unnamed protein product [Polarella glacialis]